MILEKHYSATVTAPLKSIEWGFFIIPATVKELTCPLVVRKAGNNLALCLFVVRLGLGGFAFLLRDNISCLGL